MSSASTKVAATPSAGNIREGEDQEPLEYNPRWMGYLCILTFSGINFVSISNIPEQVRRTHWASVMIFGVMTFLMASTILIVDRCQSRLGRCFNFTNCKNGYLEGSVLVFFVLWWIVGVSYITRPGGIAYTVSNIYYSAWLTIAACIYTLNEWSDSKGILSIAEITSVSFTLRYWWIHFTAAFVVFVSSISLVSGVLRLRQRLFFGNKSRIFFSSRLSLSFFDFHLGSALG